MSAPAKPKPASASGPAPAAAPEANTVAPQRVTGAQSVVRSLEELGVEVIFGRSEEHTSELQSRL